MEKLDECIVSYIGAHTFVSLTGGGGKTTLTRSLGKIYRAHHCSVLLSTTTKFQAPSRFDWDVDSWTTEFSALAPEKGKSVLYGREHESKTKWMYSGEEDLEKASRLFDRTIIEADGSRMLPLKFHTERDPVIHPCSTYTIAVIGAWAVGKSRRDVSFGYEGEDGIVDKAFLEEYLKRPECIMKGGPDLILVNGMDVVGEEVRSILYHLDWPKIPIVFGSIQKNVVERIINEEY